MANFILTIVLAVLGSNALTSLVIFLISRKDDKKGYKAKLEELVEFKSKTESQIEHHKEGLVSLLHNSLFKSSTEYITRGYITVSEVDNLNYLYSAYHNLGGNGTGDLLMKKIEQLEVKED